LLSNERQNYYKQAYSLQLIANSFLMKKEDIPQDDGALNKLTKEVVYAVDSSGKYSAELSTGWEVKAKALDVAWEDIAQRMEPARQKVRNNEASRILYFMG